MNLIDAVLGSKDMSGGVADDLLKRAGRFMRR